MVVDGEEERTSEGSCARVRCGLAKQGVCQGGRREPTDEKDVRLGGIGIPALM